MSIKSLIKKSITKLCARAVVLAYHRVSAPVSDPQLLCVSPENFESQLRFLKANYTVLPLRILAERLASGRVPHNAVSITFDDGYSDNIHFAAPLLIKHKLPATVFAVTGAIGSNSEFWWDELERLILFPKVLPAAIDVSVRGVSFTFPIAVADDAPCSTKWDVTSAAKTTDRQRVYLEVHKLLHPIESSERTEVLCHIARQVGGDSQARCSHFPLSAAELKQLSQTEGIEIGAHTRTHVSLAFQPAQRQREEIEGSFSDLKALLARPTSVFSYPYGTGADYSQQTREIIKEVGFACAVANVQGPVTRFSDLYAIPRCLVRNWSMREFANQMRLYFS